MTPFRFFRCRACGHRMRFGAQHCGKCHDITPLRNRRGTAVLLLLVLLLGLAVLVTAL